MGSDFSAIDAELDTLETSPKVDALILAHSYAGTSLELYVVDKTLNELDADRPLLRSRSSFPPEAQASSRASARAPESAPQARGARHDSEEIVLPDPVAREPQRSEHGSGEMPLHVAASRSGSFSLERHEAKPSARHSGRDDTLEPFDDELIEADEELIEFTAGGDSVRTRSVAPAASESGEPRPSLFDRKSQPAAAAQEEADAAFAELFSEATRQSVLPSTRASQAPESYGDDTETFDTSSLGFIENDVRSPEASMDEELDSAEFEIVIDDVSKSAPPSGTRSPSEAPEKRPSFLGRLFGRKED